MKGTRIMHWILASVAVILFLLIIRNLSRGDEVKPERKKDTTIVVSPSETSAMPIDSSSWIIYNEIEGKSCEDLLIVIDSTSQKIEKISSWVKNGTATFNEMRQLEFEERLIQKAQQTFRSNCDTLQGNY
jgi:hypothetical protein